MCSKREWLMDALHTHTRGTSTNALRYQFVYTRSHLLNEKVVGGRWMVVGCGSSADMMG